MPKKEEKYEIEEYEDKSWKTKTLIGGAIVGAAVGLVGAFLLTRKAEKNETKVAVTPTDGIKIGMLLFGLLKSLGQLSED